MHRLMYDLQCFYYGFGLIIWIHSIVNSENGAAATVVAAATDAFHLNDCRSVYYSII